MSTRRTRRVLNQAREHGITFSEKKFKFAESEVHFCGYMVGQTDWRMDDEKMKAIREFHTPKNCNDLRSFLGLAKKFTEFTPSLATHLQPLRDLLKNSTEFMVVWARASNAYYEKHPPRFPHVGVLSVRLSIVP